MAAVLGWGVHRALTVAQCDHGSVTQGPGPILRFALRAPRALYRHRLGWVLGRRFLLLDHVGRISGHKHQTVLEVIDYDRSSGEAVVMSGWGRTSDWFLNVEAAGHARITVGSQTVGATASVLTDSEAANVLARYESRNRWIRPVVRRVLSQLAGVHYDGTGESRLAVIHKLPLIRFTPGPSGTTRR